MAEGVRSRFGSQMPEPESHDEDHGGSIVRWKGSERVVDGVHASWGVFHNQALIFSYQASVPQ